MIKAETWARKKFSWMKPKDIIPTIRAIQEDAQLSLANELRPIVKGIKKELGIDEEHDAV